MAMEEGKTKKIVLARAEEIAEIRRKNPEISESMDKFTSSLRKIVYELGEEIKTIQNENERELIAVLVINSIHKMTDEIFLP